MAIPTGPGSRVRDARALTRLAQFAVAVAVIAGCFAVAYFHATAVGECLNASLHERQSIIDTNFRAEYAKVAGQVKGLKELNRNPRAGVALFIRASEQYLVVIKRQNAYSQSHPLGNC